MLQGFSDRLLGGAQDGFTSKQCTGSVQRSCRSSFPTARDNALRRDLQARIQARVSLETKPTNRLLVPLYKAQVLSLFGLSQRIMLLTTRGRNSQRRRDFPIGYFSIGDGIYVFSAWGKQSNWYKNLIACPRFAQVYVQIGLRRFHVRPEVVQDPQELKRIIHQLIRDDPEGAHTLMGWDPSRDDVESADFSLMIEKVLTLRFPADIAGQATPLVQGIDLGMVVPNRANGCRPVAEVVDRRL